jgi:hypothetical protein
MSELTVVQHAKSNVVTVTITVFTNSLCPLKKNYNRVPLWWIMQGNSIGLSEYACVIPRTFVRRISGPHTFLPPLAIKLISFFPAKSQVSGSCIFDNKSSPVVRSFNLQEPYGSSWSCKAPFDGTKKDREVCRVCYVSTRSTASKQQTNGSACYLSSSNKSVPSCEFFFQAFAAVQMTSPFFWNAAPRRTRTESFFTPLV